MVPKNIYGEWKIVGTAGYGYCICDDDKGRMKNKKILLSEKLAKFESLDLKSKDMTKTIQNPTYKVKELYTQNFAANERVNPGTFGIHKDKLVVVDICNSKGEDEDILYFLGSKDFVIRDFGYCFYKAVKIK